MSAKNKEIPFFEDENDFDEIEEKTSVVQSETFKHRLASAEQAPPCFVLLVGPSNIVGTQWPIQQTDLVLGRSETSHIFLNDRSVSKSHVKVLLNGGDVSIIDLESTNKTVVNGSPLSPLKEHKLMNNDQIKIGNVIIKYFEKGAIESVSAAEVDQKGKKDPLTGISNRREFELNASEGFKKSSLLGLSYYILTFDIDHFKKVNDTYGHSAGDFVLKSISALIRDNLIRGNDIFARTGGEEFCLVLIGNQPLQARDIAERIRATVESYEFVFNDEKIPITVSLGLSAKQNSDRTWNEVFERADQALYQSKNNGRNLLTIQ